MDLKPYSAVRGTAKIRDVIAYDTINEPHPQNLKLLTTALFLGV